MNKHMPKSIAIFVIILSLVISISFIIPDKFKYPIESYIITKQVCEEKYLPDSPLNINLNLETINYTAQIIDKRTNFERLVDVFIPINYDKINFDVSGEVCGGYVSLKMPYKKISINAYGKSTFYSNYNQSRRYILGVETNLEYKRVCIDNICKDISFNETDCDNAIIVRGGKEYISLDYTKETFFDVPNKQECHEEEVDEIEYVFGTICHGCSENPTTCKNECLIEANECLDKYSIYEDITSCSDFLNTCQEDCDIKLCNFDCENLYSIISSSYLTEEWLNENAECDCKTNEKGEWLCPNKDSYSVGEKLKYFKSEICPQWKLNTESGNYTITKSCYYNGYNELIDNKCKELFGNFTGEQGLCPREKLIWGGYLY